MLDRAPAGQRPALFQGRTSAARAAALLALSGLCEPSPPAEPSARPGVEDVSFCFGTVAGLGGASELVPSVLPGVSKLSSLFADLEQMLPILDTD